jgi:hypothetical protein
MSNMKMCGQFIVGYFWTMVCTSQSIGPRRSYLFARLSKHERLDIFLCCDGVGSYKKL